MDGIYTRQSVDKKDSISIETQIELCIKEVREGCDYKVYSDKGYSGSNINRPAFQELLSDVKKGVIDRIIVYRLDRMSRSLLDFANLIDMLSKYNASFVSTQEKFDTGTPMGRAMLNITMVFAQLERETIQIRITDNYYSRGEKGMYLGGPPPFGFNKIDTVVNNKKIKYLQENKDESEIISKIFEWYGTELLSLGKITSYLNEREILTRNCNKWNSSRIGMILRNPIYVKADVDVYNYYKNVGCGITNPPEEFTGTRGCLLYGKREASTRKYSTFDKHKLSLAPNEGLISSELFLKCQKRLDSNKQIDNRSWGTKSWLTGIVKCGCCERSLQVKDSVSVKKGVKYTQSYLYCTGAIEHNGCRCKKNLGRTTEIEQRIFNRIAEVATQYRDIKVKTIKEISKEREQLKVKIGQCEEKINKLIELALEGDTVSNKYLNAKIAEIDNEKHTYLDQLKKYENELGVDVADNIVDVINRWDNLNIPQKREVAKLFIEKVLLTYEDIKIYWKEDFRVKN